MILFTQESRDESFAEPRERLLRLAFDGVRANISPNLDLDVVCKTTSCRIVVRFLKSDDLEEVSDRLHLVPWGDRLTETMETVNGLRVLTFYSVVDGSLSAIDVHADYLRRAGIIQAATP